MKSLIAVLIVLVVAVAGYMVWPSEANAPEETPVQKPWNAETDPVISFTKEGYEPREVTIKVGQTVRFKNDDAEQDSWPASAVHPTHALYPEKSAADCLGSAFDSCRGLKPGEQWDFTFNSLGEWRFHDHIHPSKNGVVKVTN